MEKIFYLLLIIILSVSCSIEVEESGSSGSNDGSAASPVELTVGTAKSGSVAYASYSFYKFTTSSLLTSFNPYFPSAFNHGSL